MFLFAMDILQLILQTFALDMVHVLLQIIVYANLLMLAQIANIPFATAYLHQTLVFAAEKVLVLVLILVFATLVQLVLIAKTLLPHAMELVPCQLLCALDMVHALHKIIVYV